MQRLNLGFHLSHITTTSSTGPDRIGTVQIVKVTGPGRSIFWLDLSISNSIYGQKLQEASSEKDLGVIVSNDLKVVKQCQEAYSKANRMLGLIHRTIRYKNQKVLVSLYKSIVRPHLENCSVVWSPHYTKDKDLLERVQHRFTRMFPDLRKMPYDERLRKLGLWSLEERRSRVEIEI